MAADTESRPVSTNLQIWNTLQRFPLGNWLFSQAVRFKAPYFSTVRPLIVDLEPGLCRVKAPNRRGVHNHLGSFHAIASCNMAELAAGLMTDVTVPTTHRWIPVAMTVEYKSQATTDVTAVARLDAGIDAAGEPTELVVPVDVMDDDGTVFVTARITMRISPKRR